MYYGWWILGAGAITEMLALGSTSYAAGLFVLPLEQEFGFSRAAANAPAQIAFVAAALMAPIVGYLLDRYTVRTIVACGGVSLGLGFIIISLTSYIPLMVLALLLFVSFGGMAVGPLTTSTLTSRWFYKRRGRALSVASVATSGGGIIVVPLLAFGIQAFGWRSALFIEAILIIAIVLVLAIWVIRGGPIELGLEHHLENKDRPPSDLPMGRGGDSSPATNWRYREIAFTIGILGGCVCYCPYIGNQPGNCFDYRALRNAAGIFSTRSSFFDFRVRRIRGRRQSNERVALRIRRSARDHAGRRGSDDGLAFYFSSVFGLSVDTYRQLPCGDRFRLCASDFRRPDCCVFWRAIIRQGYGHGLCVGRHIVRCICLVCRRDVRSDGKL